MTENEPLRLIGYDRVTPIVSIDRGGPTSVTVRFTLSRTLTAQEQRYASDISRGGAERVEFHPGYQGVLVTTDPDNLPAWAETLAERLTVIERAGYRLQRQEESLADEATDVLESIKFDKF